MAFNSAGLLTVIYLKQNIFLQFRTVPTKYKSPCARLISRGESRSLQGLLESKKKKKLGIARHFFEIISFESQQKY